jgi:hypothetical protein
MTVNITERMHNMYSIDCRAGDESEGRTGLERGRSHKAERLIGSRNGLVSLISEWFQNIESGNESRDTEKERFVDPMFQAPIEVEMLEMQRIERRTEDLRMEARDVWKPVIIRLEDIERPHRKQNHLR